MKQVDAVEILHSILSYLAASSVASSASAGSSSGSAAVKSSQDEAASVLGERVCPLTFLLLACELLVHCTGFKGCLCIQLNLCYL